MHVQICRSRNATNEEEQDVEAVEDERQDRVDHDGVLDARGEEVCEREHGEDAAEEVETDHGAVAAGREVVAGERDDEEGPEELERTVSDGTRGRFAEVQRTERPAMAMLMMFVAAIATVSLALREA